MNAGFVKGIYGPQKAQKKLDKRKGMRQSPAFIFNDFDETESRTR
jgi:hypothetical protein